VAHTKHPFRADLKPKRPRWPTFAVVTLYILEFKMNPKLKEIAFYATEYDKNGQERSFDKEAFARMIVRECAGLAQQGGDILEEFGVR